MGKGGGGHGPGAFGTCGTVNPGAIPGGGYEYMLLRLMYHKHTAHQGRQNSSSGADKQLERAVQQLGLGGRYRLLLLVRVGTRSEVGRPEPNTSAVPAKVIRSSLDCMF